MTQPTTDLRAVVRAIDALTTQVKRVADRSPTPVADGDDGAATTATTCPARYASTDPMRWCIRPADHDEHHTDSAGFHWADHLAVYPMPGGVVAPFITVHGDPDMSTAAREALGALADVAARQMAAPCAQHPSAPVIGGLCGGCTVYLPADMRRPPACRIMETRTCPPSYNGPCGDRPCARFESDDPAPWQDSPAADEDAVRTARRSNLRDLRARLASSVPLTRKESDRLRSLLADEVRDGDTARAKAGDLAETCKRERRRGDVLAEERHAAQAAIERVRAECRAMESDLAGAEDDGMRAAINRVRYALDGTE
ncbi:hypothetical protein [Streptomyces sp. NBC_01171]|uniref:hypothetical protein n=1 Tax=Streptomyces sp. NBC_01171 TaxID=2903757 RepID=UPI00386A6DD3|nr:hypothetical protein OG448_15115 [Streptomyces sp. NBC_01171]